MPEPEQIAAGYQWAVSLIRSRILQLSTTAWDTLGSYRDSDIDRLVQLLIPQVQAGQIQVANLTAAYMNAVLAASGEAPQVSTVAREQILAARGVAPEQVYRRPANELYTALSQGKPFEAAVALGRSRLISLVSTDLQMAKVRQADASLHRSGAQYYRRVLKGESNCAKCIITSTRRYKVGKLLPIHPGCDCDVAPVKGSNPPEVLDTALLEATHEQIGAFAGIENRNAQSYQDLIVTHEHGEIGPVLSWRNQNFRGPSDL